ncbi:MAG: hypothetical protein R3330_08535, partial [Saprospiraceae bacterium]|nr:hypothetical protein [Saprospiraceae bacterium]
MVGPGVVVDDISGELAGFLANQPDYQHCLDGYLSNYTVIALTNPSGVDDLPIISIKYTDAQVTPGRRAGFVMDIDNSTSGLLGQDVLDSLEINTYLDNALQETAAVTGSGPILSMDISGGSGSVRRIGFINTLPFDELELIFNGSASNEVSEFRIYYAYHMDPTCDYHCANTLTLDNYPGLIASSGCTGILCNATGFDDPPDATTDADPSNYDSTTVVPLGSAWIEIEIGQDIAGGSDAGFAVSTSDLAGGGLLSAEALNAIEISTYHNGQLQETFLFDSTANVNVISGDINLVSYKTSSTFDALRITFSALTSINHWSVYYGFTRPDSDNDNFVDCIDACLGDNNYDLDGDGEPDDCDENCLYSAGPDFSACPVSNTAAVEPAPSGYGWSAAPGNPGPATIDNSGAITGLTSEGV